MKTKICITTLGCKVNQYESAAFRSGFEICGFEIVTVKEKADIVVINTCAVTGSAGAQSRQSIRQVLRRSPDARVMITGCYAELSAEELKKEKELQGRDFILVGNSEKDKLVPLATGQIEGTGKDFMGVIKKPGEICRLPVTRFGSRARAYLRVQDGCESFCTYCIVPYTRGPSRSLPINEVLEQARTFIDEGHKELVLTGIHLGNYGKDLSPRENVVSLLDQLTAAAPATHFRISSLEPLEITDELLALISERKNIQPHLHIPLQAGHDTILKQMNRRYTTTQFRDVLHLCLKTIPDLAIGIDILTGFPGETDRHFSESVSFLESLDFTYLHVFPYSKRPGTTAASLSHQVPKNIKDNRVAQLRILSENKRDTFYRKHLGQIRQVLVEGLRDSDGLLKGVTDNYISVRFKGPDTLRSGFADVRLEKIRHACVIGKRITSHES